MHPKAVKAPPLQLDKESTGPKVIDISKQFRDGPQFFRDGTVDLNPTRKPGTRANKGTRTKKPYNGGNAVKRLDAKKR